MKISKKLIGITVASLGMVFSIGGAIALYQTAADNAGFGISAGAYAGSGGTVTYKINNTAGNSSINPVYMTGGGEDGGTGLSATYTQVKYEVALSAVYAAGANAQDFVVGNLAVSVTNIPEAYRGKLSIAVAIDGYENNSLGKATYEHIFGEDFAITEEAQSYNVNKNIAVASAGVQVARIYLKYNLAGIDTLTQNEVGLGYTLNVAWGEATNEFVPAYIVGNGNQWTKDDGYSMAPNINKANAEGWEWVYNNLPGTMESAKCIINDTWSDDPNASLDAEKSYNVYWNGNGDAAANFAEIAPQP